jgi:glucokinase
VERACSGIGIPNVHQFLRDEEKIPERPETAELIPSSKARSRSIVEGALDPKNPSDLCGSTIEVVVSILAGEEGNLALKVLATGEILTGSVGLHLLPALQVPQFMGWRA